MEFLPRRKSSTGLSLKKKHRGIRFSMDSPTVSPAGCSSADEGMIIDSDNENDVPETGPSDYKVLKDVVAYVEVRTKMENRSNSVCKQLERLGAVVVKKFTNDEPVTHVVWKDGKKSTKDKAIKRGIHLVSVLWVDSCKQNQRRAEESLFPVTDCNEDTAIVIPRRMKSMQPKSFEEDLESSTERMVRKRKKKETVQPSRLYLNSPVAVMNPLVYAAETQDPFTPVGTPVPGQGGTPSLIPDTPASMRACLDALSRVRNSANTPTSGSEKPVIGESPTFGGKPDVPQKKLSFSPSIDANSPADGTKNRKTDPKNKPKKGRRSEGQGSAKKDSSKVRRLSLRIEKTISEQETDEDPIQPNKTGNLPEIPQNGPTQKLVFPDVQKICTDSNKHSGGKFKTKTDKAVLFCETNLHSRAVEPRVAQPRKRKLLSTNTDVIPNLVLTEPKKSSKKDVLPKKARLSGKSSRNLSDRFEKAQDITHQGSNSRDEGLLKDLKSTEFCGKSDGKSPGGGKSTRKRKKEVLSSESSGEETTQPVKKRKENNDKTPPSVTTTQHKRGSNTPNSRRSLDDFAQNKRLKQLKAKQRKPPKNRSASLSTLNPVSEEKVENPVSEEKVENGIAEKPKLVNNKKSARPQSLTGDSTTGGGKIRNENHSNGKPRKTSRTNSAMPDDDSDGSASNSETDKTSQKDKAIKVTKSTKKLKSVKPSIVMTSVHAGDQDLVTSVIKKLKRFTMEDNVSHTTTHIVCGESRRTLNLLRGIARGCWLLSVEWVLKSLEAEKWLPEEPYEIQDAFPAAKIARQERCKSGSSFKRDLFSSLGPIYVSETSSPPKAHLVELIELCSGITCGYASQASLCIGGGRNQTGTPAVLEKWLLDCISQHQTLPLDNYLL
ncbi:microcephalin-like isoform X3 [Patiria miniata]|uniref:BRCT domain-containing protein n=1 Tax=Patiria miniata TaxID=46514 RepID=A0A913Z6H3_PATMI|nr:microcephalin-like isoform X3 [Patiria miniata]